MAKKTSESAAKTRGKKVIGRRGAAAKANSGMWVLGLLAALFVGLIVFLFYISQPAAAVSAMGEEVPVASADHVPEGTDPGPYPTDPPVGGKHYPTDLDAGFYDEAKAAEIPFQPEGYLVHSLEHGYIIYYYNCAANPNIPCEEITQGIQTVMGEFNNVEVIGYPWPSQAEPIVMASWGRIMRLNTVDLNLMRQFYRANLNKAPEPMAD